MAHPNSEYRRIDGHDDELLPCPFCGAAAELWEYRESESESSFTKVATCGDSECDMYMSNRDFHKATKREAIKAWNRRSQPASSEEPYAWRVPPMSRCYFGEHAKIDAEAEARRVGGTAKAIPLYTHPAAQGDAVLVPRGLAETIVDTAEDGFIDYQIVARLRALLGWEG